VKIKGIAIMRMRIKLKKKLKPNDWGLN